MYYKIISEGKIVDACDGLNYVRWQEKNRIFLSCEAEDAEGIVTSNGADIYLLPDVEAVEGFAYATATEITEEEYTALRDELDAGGTVIEPDEDPDGDSPGKTRLRLLEEQVAELAEANAMLTECLLEMSEVVYGE